MQCYVINIQLDKKLLNCFLMWLFHFDYHQQSEFLWDPNPPQQSVLSEFNHCNRSTAVFQGGLIHIPQMIKDATTLSCVLHVNVLFGKGYVQLLGLISCCINGIYFLYSLDMEYLHCSCCLFPRTWLSFHIINNVFFGGWQDGSVVKGACCF